MINEKQANTLLNECEEWLGIKLIKLRTSLRGDHQNTMPILWELIVFHAVASYVKFKNDQSSNPNETISSQIQHEPGEKRPDILLQPDFSQPFNIEVKYTKYNRQQDQDLGNFNTRVREELSKIGFTDRSLRIRLDPANPEKTTKAPFNGFWNHYFDSPQWKNFATKVLAGDLPLNWDIGKEDIVVESTRREYEGNIVVKAAKEGQEYMTYSPSPHLISITESPIYKAIREKIGQAQKWCESGGRYQPLVLIIGASEILTQTSNLNILSDENINKAIHLALRIDHAELISAVVFVDIRNEFSSGCGYNFQRRARKPLIIENPHPNVSLTVEQRYMLEQIDFNKVEYGSNLEHWDRITGDINKINLHKYTQGLEQSFVIASENFNYDFKYPFSVEIPCDPFACLLTGLIDNTKFWGDNDTCIIKTCIENAIVVTHPIVNIELVNTGFRHRQGSRVKIDFGAACFTRIRKTSLAKDSQYYLNNNADGTIGVAIDADFILDILTSTKNVEELWIIEGQEELYKSLKEMVGKCQKIIGLSLVQNPLNSDEKTHIIFTFGAAIKTLIREEENVLIEEEQSEKLRKHHENIRLGKLHRQ
jgi:hypothetical protein